MLLIQRVNNNECVITLERILKVGVLLLETYGRDLRNFCKMAHVINPCNSDCAVCIEALMYIVGYRISASLGLLTRGL